MYLQIALLFTLMSHSSLTFVAEKWGNCSVCSTLIKLHSSHLAAQRSSVSGYVVPCSCNPNVYTDSINIVKCHIPICFPPHTAPANIEKTLGSISVWLITFFSAATVCWIRCWCFGIAVLVGHFSALQSASCFLNEHTWSIISCPWCAIERTRNAVGVNDKPGGEWQACCITALI